MDRNSAHQSRISVDFGEFIVRPFFVLFCKVFPGSKLLIRNLGKNLKEWRRIALKEEAELRKEDAKSIDIGTTTTDTETSEDSDVLSPLSSNEMFQPRFIPRRFSVASGLVEIPHYDRVTRRLSQRIVKMVEMDGEGEPRTLERTRSFSSEDVRFLSGSTRKADDDASRRGIRQSGAFSMYPETVVSESGSPRVIRPPLAKNASEPVPFRPAISFPGPMIEPLSPTTPEFWLAPSPVFENLELFTEVGSRELAGSEKFKPLLTRPMEFDNVLGTKGKLKPAKIRTDSVQR